MPLSKSAKELNRNLFLPVANAVRLFVPEQRHVHLNCLQTLGSHGDSLKAFPASGQARNVIKQVLEHFQGFQIQMSSKIIIKNLMMQMFIVFWLTRATKIL